MTYKLKQWYPSLPKDWIVGMIIGKNDGHPMFTPTNSKYKYCVISKTEVQSNDYWSPYLFTTEDGVDIYKWDSAYIVKFEDMQWQYLFCKTVYASINSPTKKYFSTKEAAQKWIDSQRKPIWKTEDGEDVFENEPVKWVIYSIVDNQWKYHYDLSMYVPGCATTNPETFRVFKNEDKMNKWIEEQNRPKFEKGEWLYMKMESTRGKIECIGRYNYTKENNHWFSEEYSLRYGDVNTNEFFIQGIQETSWSTAHNVVKADTETIQRILSKVALHKGFKKDVKFKSVMSGHIHSVSEYLEFTYNDDNDALLESWGWCVYKDGKWAEIIEEGIPEYVEVLKDTCPLMKGDICKVVDGVVKSHRYEGKNSYLEYEYPDKHLFKLSTKEAYDAQFQIKELTITLDGDVVNTSHWDNNVKIVYK